MNDGIANEVIEQRVSTSRPIASQNENGWVQVNSPGLAAWSPLAAHYTVQSSVAWQKFGRRR